MRAFRLLAAMTLVAVAVGCAPALIHPPQVPQLRRHEGPRLPLPAIQILTAGRQGDQAQERSGHGVFTEVLLRGLQGDAFAGEEWLALEELGLWLKQRVFAESNKKQVPQYGNFSGEGQFVFILPSARP